MELRWRLWVFGVPVVVVVVVVVGGGGGGGGVGVEVGVGVVGVRSWPLWEAESPGEGGG